MEFAALVSVYTNAGEYLLLTLLLNEHVWNVPTAAVPAKQCWRLGQENRPIFDDWAGVVNTAATMAQALGLSVAAPDFQRLQKRVRGSTRQR
ncbi:MAG: hypothetical protein GY772_07760 [bacterium]|nr:hypothetical protein [bacterium]